MNIQQESSRKNVTAQGYLPFLDGLRAISILAVVSYHAGIPYVRGGFVGVDVFFVISGYLIISQISSGLKNGTFSFSKFWARRALRILPTYLLVILVSLTIASYVLVLPEEFTAFAEQIFYSSLMVVNHLFLAQQGYFDGGATSKPLLHLWSLAVEEQFYLVAPVLMVAVCIATKKLRLAGGAAAAFYGTLFLVSLYFCIRLTGSGDDKNHAFYLMPLRAWEFIAGGSLLFIARFLPGGSRLTFDALATAGLAMIAVAIVLYSSRSAFPSYLAALPVGGACIVILAGLRRPDSIVIRWLAAPPMILLGLVSYAWYLWHWPLLTFWRIYNFNKRDLFSDSIAVLIALALAALTYLAVERPIRNWRSSRAAPLGWKPALLGVLACVPIAISGSGYAKHSAEQAASSLPSSLQARRDSDFEPCSAGKSCGLLATPSSVGLMWGDSHTRAIYPHFQRALAKQGVLVLSSMLPACPPMAGVIRNDGSSAAAECAENTRITLEAIGGATIPEFAILSARWTSYRTGQRIKLKSQDGEDLQYSALIRKKLRETIVALKAAGVSRILVIGALPDFPRDPSRCVIRSDRHGIERERNCARTTATAARKTGPATQWVEDAISGIEGVRLFDPMPIFCDRDWCRPYSGDTVYFYDDDHLSSAGAAKLFEAVDVELRWLVGKSVSML